jgi:hypothetical protein
MKYTIIVTHQGWTDIIVCLGIFFYLSKIKEKIVLLIREDSKDFIDYLFQNNEKIIIEYMAKNLLDKKRIKHILKKYKNYEFFGAGEFWNPCIDKKLIPGSIEYFYSPLNVPIDSHFKNFEIERNYKLENDKYYDIISNIGNNYIVLNEDPERNLLIDRNHIKKYNIFFNINNSSKILFDMLKILENASEIHLISTFWSFLIKILQKRYNMFQKIPIYFHKYVRNNYYDCLYKDTNWIIIN